MNQKEKLRKLKVLMGKCTILWIHVKEFKKTKESDLELFENYEKNHKNSYSVMKDRHNIYKLAKELNISDEELVKTWYSTYTERYKVKREYNKKPTKEGRDNKDVLVGSRGSNRNKIRYPSKKRSLSTWKKFYKLFPIEAVIDEFDGTTSKRMK